MNFNIGLISQVGVEDDELFELLKTVYVGEGYTSRELAETLFLPLSVRDRGVLFIARELRENNFAGMVIVVPSNSPASVLASENQCEMHLLAVKEEFRGFKLGKKLVTAALDYSKEHNFSKMILWTQVTMKSTQNLYKSCDFKEVDKMKRNETEFLIYEKKIT